MRHVLDLTLLRMRLRGGKTSGLNAGVDNARGDVIVFSDANAMYRGDAIRALVTPYADGQIGAVIGESADMERLRFAEVRVALLALRNGNQAV